jgi:hypothetical protein
MECDDRSFLEQWTTTWADLVEFDLIPVVTPAERRRRYGFNDEAQFAQHLHDTHGLAPVYRQRTGEVML